MAIHYVNKYCEVCGEQLYTVDGSTLLCGKCQKEATPVTKKQVSLEALDKEIKNLDNEIKLLENKLIERIESLEKKLEELNQVKE